MTPVPWEESVRANKMGVTVGAGMKVAVHRRVSIRPEVLFVDTTPGSGWNWGWVRGPVGRWFAWVRGAGIRREKLLRS
jgi:hypothetical protein